MRLFFKIFIFVLLIFIMGGNRYASAYQVETLKDVPVENDFVLGGGKVELFLNPGEKYIKEITVTNRLGKRMDFEINIEDFKGSRNIEQSVVLLGNEKGPYSLKDYLKPDITKFTLDHGQRMMIEVEVDIPPDAEPGGLYGSVLVSAHPPLSAESIEAEKAKGQISLITRLGSLFFVRIKGAAREDASLKEFKTINNFYEKTPIPFQIIFENNGSVHLTPSGKIEIKNLLGKKIDEVDVDLFFALPDSLKYREIKWDKGLLLGRYTAVLSLNRGYRNIIDQKTISFWVIPWKEIIIGIIILAIIVRFLWWFGSKFELKRKE